MNSLRSLSSNSKIDKYWLCTHQVSLLPTFESNGDRDTRNILSLLTNSLATSSKGLSSHEQMYDQILWGSQYQGYSSRQNWLKLKEAPGDVLSSSSSRINPVDPCLKLYLSTEHLNEWMVQYTVEAFTKAQV